MRQYVQSLSIKFRDSVCKKQLQSYFSPELPNIYLSRDIKSVSELYGQKSYKNSIKCCEFVMETVSVVTEIFKYFL
jgi:hypothetical protein